MKEEKCDKYSLNSLNEKKGTFVLYKTYFDTRVSDHKIYMVNLSTAINGRFALPSKKSTG